MSDKQMPMPPATFEFLVFSLRTQAEMNMGIYSFGGDDEAEPNLVLARHAIDLLGIIQEKSKGNLTLEEDRLLNNSLTELRFRFVQAQEKAKEPPLVITPEEPRIILP